MARTGTAAGHPWMQTAADPAGRTVLGTMSNCAMGYTPWGTYLTCEENFQFYFVNESGSVPALQQRYDINERVGGDRWLKVADRSEAARALTRPRRAGLVLACEARDP